MSYRPDISLNAIGKLTFPILAANFSIMGTGIIDTVMAGRLGAEHLAAVAVGNATVVLVVITLANILQSLSPIAGHLYGARKLKEIGVELVQCLWLAVPICLLGVFILLQTDFWIRFGHLTGNVADMTRLFLIASAAGIPAVVFSRPYLTVNAAVNRPKIAMWISFGLLAAKVPLNCLFMFGALGCPSYGGAGAAIATAISCYLGLIAYILVWKISPFYKDMRVEGFCSPRWNSIVQHLKLGVPISFSAFFEISSFTLMAIFIARIGTEAVAGHQIVANVTATIYQIPFSIGIAASVLVAQCCGAKEFVLARESSIRCLKVAFLIALIFSVILLFSRYFLAGLYTSDATVITVSANTLLFAVFYHGFDAIQAVTSFSLRGYKVTFLPMVIYAVCLWAIGLGGGYYFGFYAQSFGGPFGVYGFWGATSVGLALAALCLLVFWQVVSKERARLQSAYKKPLT